MILITDRNDAATPDPIRRAGSGSHLRRPFGNGEMFARRHMNRFIWLALTLSTFPGRATAQVTCPAPNGRMVTVASGVRLEVIEWGGAGTPLLFLSGMGQTAHAFDPFAPKFADRHRVVESRGGAGAAPPVRPAMNTGVPCSWATS